MGPTERRSTDNAVFVAPAHRCGFPEAAQPEQLPVQAGRFDTSHHVGGHQPDRRPQFEAMPTESGAKVESASWRDFINHWMPIGRDGIQGCVAPCALTSLHFGEALDKPLSGVSHEVQVYLLPVAVGVNDRLFLRGVDQADQGQAPGLISPVRAIGKISYHWVGPFVPGRASEESDLDTA